MDERFQDQRLVKRLLAHDREAFHEFFNGYFPRLHRFARARLSDDLDATREIVHVTLSKAIQKLHTYRGEAALFTWMCTICRRELHDHFKRLAKDQHGSRADVIAKYRARLWREIRAGHIGLDELAALHGKRLACWCRPSKPCHGDVLAAAARWATERLRSPGD